MNSKHEEYLISIGFQPPLIDWAREVIDLCQQVLSESVGQSEFEIFVSEHVDGGGRRNYESLWIFTPRLGLEAKDFKSPSRLCCFVLRYATKWVLNRKQFDGKAVSADSRLTIEIGGSEDDVVLKASGDNCTKLFNVFRQYVVPNTGGPIETITRGQN